MDHSGSRGKRQRGAVGKALSAIGSLVVLALFLFGATLLAPELAEAQYSKKGSCTNCHTAPALAANASVLVAVDGTELTPTTHDASVELFSRSVSVSIPASTSFEVDFTIQGINRDTGVSDFMGNGIFMPPAWEANGGTAPVKGTANSPGLAGWNAVWDGTDARMPQWLNHATASGGVALYDTLVMYGQDHNDLNGDGATGDPSAWHATKGLLTNDGATAADLDGSMLHGADAVMTTPSVAGDYIFYIIGAGGNGAGGGKGYTSTKLTITVTAGGDVTDPVDGATFTATGGQDGQVPLSWDPATDDTAVDHYRVVHSTVGFPAVDCTDGAEVYNALGTSTTHVGATNDIVNYYRVCAYDAAANVSPGLTDSATPVAPDVTDPTDGATFTATAGQDGQVPLSWDPATDDTAVDHYRVVYRTDVSPAATCTDGTEIYNALGTSTTHTPATNGTTYYYRVCAYDAAANVSPGLTDSAAPAAGCTVNVPTVSIDTTYNKQVTSDGGSVTYDITVNNNDSGGGCGPVSFDLVAIDGNLTDFDPSSFGTDPLVIGPGSGNTTLIVKAKAGAPRGAINDVSFKVTAAGHTDSDPSPTRTTVVNVPGAPVSNYSVGDIVHFEFQTGTQFANGGVGALSVKDSAGVAVPGSPFTMVEVSADGLNWVYVYDWDTTGRAVDSYQSEILDGASLTAGGGLELGNPANTITFFADPNYSSAKDIFKDGDEVYVEVLLSGAETATTTSTLDDWYATLPQATGATVDLSGGNTYRYHFTVDFVTAGINDTDWGSIFWQGTDTGVQLKRGIQRNDSTPDVTEPIVTAFDIPAADTVTLVNITTLTEWDDTLVTEWLLAEDDSVRPLVGDGRWTGVKPTDFPFSGAGAHTLHAWVKDAAGNVSLNPVSDSITITPTDVTDPVDGSTLTATGGQDGQVPLSWDPASDDTAVDHYRVVYRTDVSPAATCTDGTQIYNALGTSTTHTPATNGTTYYYRVCAYDAAANVSPGLTATATPVATPVVTLGDGGLPASSYATASDANVTVSSFTLQMNNGSDTVTDIVVTGTNTGNVGAVRIYDDSTGTVPNEYDASDSLVDSSTFSGATATFNGLSISVTTGIKQYLIVYDIGGAVTDGQTLTAFASTVTAATYSVSGTDNADATVTIDDLAPVTYDDFTPGWTLSNVTVNLTEDDGAGSSVASTAWCVDTANSCTPGVNGDSFGTGLTINVTQGAGTAGTQYARYASTDAVGNVQTTVSLTVQIDKSVPAGGVFSPVGGDAQVDIDFSGWADTGSGLNTTTTYVVRRRSGGTAPVDCISDSLVYSGTSSALYNDAPLTNDQQYAYRLCVYDELGNLAQSTATATPTATPVVTVGDGAAPANSFAGASDTNVTVSSFTLQMNNNSDTVTDIVVSGTNTANVSAVRIYDDSTGTLANEYDASDSLVDSSTFSVGTATFNGLSIPVTTGSKQYLVVYDIGGAPTDGHQLTASLQTVTAATYGVTNNDNLDATVTIDAAAPTTTNDFVPGWTGSDVTVLLTEEDGAGSSVANTAWCVDSANTCTPGVNGTSFGTGTTINVTQGGGTAGTQYARYASTDAVGNVQATVSLTVQIDKALPAGGVFNPAAGDAQVDLDFSGWSDADAGLNTTTTYVVRRAVGGTAPVDCSSDALVYSGTSSALYNDAPLSNSQQYAYRLCVYDEVGNFAQTTTTATPIATPAVTVGDGTAPAASYAGPSNANIGVSTFTLQMNNNSDTVTDIVVTGTNTANVGAVDIYDDSTGTVPNEYDASDSFVASSTFSGATATFNGLSIPVTTAIKQYLIVYDIGGAPTDGQTLTAFASTVTAATYLVTNNDNADNAVTIDAAGPVTSDNFTPGWTGSDVTVNLTEADGTGVGVASTAWCVDTVDSCTPGVDGDSFGTGTTISVTQGAGTAGTQYARYASTDAVGNVQGTVSLTVQIDKELPVITMLGSTPVNVTVNTSYTDAGATASDNVDGDLTGSISVVNNVDINTIADGYTVTYDVFDSNGNNAVQVVRTVNVKAEVCNTNAPAVSIAPTGRTIGKDGGMAVYTVTVTNNDSGGACTDRAFALTTTDTDNVTNFFASTVESSVTVTGNGGTNSVNLWVTARAGAVDTSSNNTYVTTEAVNSNTVTTDIAINSGGLQSRGSFVNASGDQFIISK